MQYCFLRCLCIWADTAVKPEGCFMVLELQVPTQSVGVHNFLCESLEVLSTPVASSRVRASCGGW